ncbi:MAG: DUF4097 family beta strand repeat-containing protein, partial [Candidatus Poribacteria bacterium]
MNKAREIILRLLSEGKITIEEAEELLDAMPNEKIGRSRFARTSRNAGIPHIEGEPSHGFKFEFHFPWDDPNWKWPWEEKGWQWPWESTGKEDEGNKLSFYVEENSRLSIKSGDGNLSISMADDDNRLAYIYSDNKDIKSILSEDKMTHLINLGDTNAEIIIPPRISSVKISKDDGDISINDLQSNIDLKSGDGSIAIVRLKGNINLAMNDGNLMIRDANSEEIILKSNDGNILLDNIISKNVVVKMNDGMVSMDIADTVTEGNFSITVDDGRISLSLPANSSFRVIANVEDGIIKHNLKNDLDKRFESADVQHT